MRRDVGFYVEADIRQVYDAYLKAAMNPPFERSCKQEPLHTISFGINFSFKYNINGGSCNIHLMPMGAGTAVNIRFSLAQAAGARYELYANNLNAAVQRFLPVRITPANYNMDDFLRPENQLTEASAPQAIVAPQQAPAPTPQPAPAGFCTACGNGLQAGARFCGKCGAAVKQERVCVSCQAPLQEGSIFCTACGMRQP